MQKWISPSVVDQFDEGSYTYRLVGVVVHRGSADAGHYYSFIQDRSTSSWNKFDDRTVESFNIHVCLFLLIQMQSLMLLQNLEQETFGTGSGQAQSHNYNSYYHSHSWVIPSYSNSSTLQGSQGSDKGAYILVYEQMKYKDEWKTEEKKRILKEAAPKTLITNINTDNEASIKLRLRFDPSYFDFLEKFIGMLEFKPVTCTSQQRLGRSIFYEYWLISGSI
jgi:hypothetical protein